MIILFKSLLVQNKQTILSIKNYSTPIFVNLIICEENQLNFKLHILILLLTYFLWILKNSTSY